MRIASILYCCADACFMAGLRSGHNWYCSTKAWWSSWNQCPSRLLEILGPWDSRGWDCTSGVLFFPSVPGGHIWAIIYTYLRSRALKVKASAVCSSNVHMLLNRQWIKFCIYWPRLLLIRFLLFICSTHLKCLSNTFCMQDKIKIKLFYLSTYRAGELTFLALKITTIIIYISTLLGIQHLAKKNCIIVCNIYYYNTIILCILLRGANNCKKLLDCFVNKNDANDRRLNKQPVNAFHGAPWPWCELCLFSVSQLVWLSSPVRADSFGSLPFLCKQDKAFDVLTSMNGISKAHVSVLYLNLYADEVDAQDTDISFDQLDDSNFKSQKLDQDKVLKCFRSNAK